MKTKQLTIVTLNGSYTMERPAEEDMGQLMNAVRSAGYFVLPDIYIASAHIVAMLFSPTATASVSKAGLQ